MAKIRLDDNLSNTHLFLNIETGRTPERTRPHVVDESIKILLSGDLHMSKTNSGQTIDEITAGGYCDEIN